MGVPLGMVVAVAMGVMSVVVTGNIGGSHGNVDGG